MSLFIILIYIIIISFFLRFYYINIKFSNIDPIRCNWLSIPIFGHFYNVNFNKPFYEIYNNTKHLINEKLFSIWFMDQYMVFITDPYVARDFLVKNSDNFLNRPITYSSRLFSHNFSSLSQSRDQRWFDIRNTFSHIATNLLLRRKTNYIEDKTKELIQWIADDSNNQLSPSLVESNKITKPYLLNILYEYFNRSESFKTTMNDPSTNELLKYLFDFLQKTQGKAFMNSNVFGLAISFYHRITGLKLVYKPYKLLQKLLVDDHLNTIDRENPRDAIDELILLNEKYPAHQQSMENVVSPIFDMFVPGINTSSLILEWFMLLMANYPKVQNQIYNELMDILEKDKSSTEKFIGIKHKSDAVLLNSVINEVFRYKMGTSGGPRQTKEDIIINGKFIPKNTGVAILTIAIFNDPNYWKNPEEFIPDRFCNNDEKTQKQHMDRLLQFGIGKRSCPGKNISLDETFLFCSNMILNFSWSSENGEKLNEIPDFNLNSFPAPHKLLIKKR